MFPETMHAVQLTGHGGLENTSSSTPMAGWCLKLP